MSFCGAGRILGVVASRRSSPVVLPDISFEACTPALRERLLAENPLFAELSADKVAEVNRRFADTGFEAEQAIIHEGERAERLYIVAMGIVKLFRTTESGGTVLIDILSEGDYFGSIAGYGPHYYEETAVARSTVCALSIGTEEFRAILREHASVGLRAVEALSDRLSLAHRMVQHLGGYPAEARVAYVLLRLADKLGRPWEGATLIGAPVSREEIASMAGTTPETASRVLSGFQRSGAVVAGRGWVAVSDAAALREAAPDAEI